MKQLWCAGRAVAEYDENPDLAILLGPRPYLHPVRTLAGLTVTDALPPDHPWHLGVSVGVQHVEAGDAPSVNFWGGRTYLPDAGYTWLDDHGRVEHVGWIEPCAGEPAAGLAQELAWRAPDQQVLLRERRTITTQPLAPAGAVPSPGWQLRLGFTLENVTPVPVSLGSPGARGRAGGGYGGFFWRAATSRNSIRVATPEAEGEDAVHGHPAEWLIFGGSDPDTGRDWSLLLAGQDADTRADPWFVRTRDYPGVGSALAYEKPVVLEPGAALTRSVLVAVLDGVLDRSQAPAVLTAARGE